MFKDFNEFGRTSFNVEIDLILLIERSKFDKDVKLNKFVNIPLKPPLTKTIEVILLEASQVILLLPKF
jgi:hypothetical protein